MLAGRNHHTPILAPNNPVPSPLSELTVSAQSAENETPRAAYSSEHILQFIKGIPQQDRAQAILTASQNQAQLIESAWRLERSRLPADFVSSNRLTEDTAGWNRYLSAQYQIQSDDQRERFTRDEWAARYRYDMLKYFSTNHSDVDYLLRARTDSGTPLPAPDRSFKEHFSKFNCFDLELARARWGKIDSSSLLVHSLTQESMEKVIETGVVGRDGVGYCCMCQDRIVYDDGFVVVFQAQDLLAAGYDLFEVHEDPRDSHVLNEWRSSAPIDIHLARLILPSGEAPDIAKVTHNPQIARWFCGEEFLRQIERLPCS